MGVVFRRTPARKTDASETLQDERLLRIFRRVQEVPGLSLSELARSTGMEIWQVANALDALERVRLTRSLHVNHQRRVFEDRGSLRWQKHVAVLRYGRALRVAALIRDQPGITQSEILESTGLQRARLRPMMDLLSSAGLVRELRDGRHRRYHSTPHLGPAMNVAEPPALADPRPEPRTRAILSDGT